MASPESSETDRRKMVRLSQLGGMSKRALATELIRNPGFISAAHSPYGWTRDELIGSIIGLEFPATPGVTVVTFGGRAATVTE